MSNENNSGSFSHAFLPGLILGLVIGAAAGAFLPDLMGGNRIPTAGSGGNHTPAEPRDAEGSSQEDIQGIIDEAEKQAGEAADDLADDAQGLLEDGAEKVEEVIDDVTESIPTPPGS
ncbi:MAG: hypothetical protein AB8F26_09520 [Phycisphaerales bacterium]